MYADDFPDFGEAQWADRTELNRGGFYRSGGIYIGHDPQADKPLYFNGEGHILTVAPPGFGKTTALIIPNLVTYNYGSIVAIDPKGTLTAQTKRRREELGNRVIVLNPWRNEIARKGDGSIGIDLGDCGFNPLRDLRPDNPSLIDEAENLLSIVQPIPHSGSANEKFFAETSQTILTGCAVLLARLEGGVTLPRLYTFVRQSRDEWNNTAEKMILNWLAPYGSELLTNLEAPKQWAAVQASMNQATKIYNPAKPLGHHLMRDEFNPDDLKRENITVYVVIPSNRRASNSAWLGLVMATIAQSVGKPSKASPVTLICEEFANIGYQPSIPQAMAEYREAGLKVHIVVQSLNQLSATYGIEGAQNIVNICNVRQFFGVGNLEMATGISRAIGNYTAFVLSDEPQPRVIGKKGATLAPPEKIMNMPEDEQIILTTGGTPAIHAKLIGYWKNPEIAPHVDPNPLRPGELGNTRSVKYQVRRLRDQIKVPALKLAAGVWERVPERAQPPIHKVGKGFYWVGREIWLWLRSQFAKPATFHKFETLTKEDPTGGHTFSPWVRTLFWAFLIYLIIDVWGQ